MKGPITATHQKYLQRCLEQLASNDYSVLLVADTRLGGHCLQFGSYRIFYEASKYVLYPIQGKSTQYTDFVALCEAFCHNILANRFRRIAEPPLSKKVAATAVLHGIYDVLNGELTCDESGIYDIICDGYMMEFSFQVNDEESVRVCLKPEHLEGCFVKKSAGDTLPE